MAEVKLPEEPPGAKAPGRRARWRAVVPFAIGALVAALAISNRDEVEVDWLVTTWRTPLVIVIVVSLLAGLVAGWLLGARRSRE